MSLLLLDYDLFIHVNTPSIIGVSTHLDFNSVSRSGSWDTLVPELDGLEQGRVLEVTEGGAHGPVDDLIQARSVVASRRHPTPLEKRL